MISSPFSVHNQKTVHVGIQFKSAQAKSLISEGHLDALVEDLAALPKYWEGMSHDYPSHPVASDSRRWSTSLGYTLYCNWVMVYFDVIFHQPNVYIRFHLVP